MPSRESERSKGQGPDPEGGRPVGRHVLSSAQWARTKDSLRLSNRQLELAQFVFDDADEAAIARALGISPNTVHGHFGRLYRKLHVGSHAGVVLCVMAQHANGRAEPGRDGPSAG